MVGKRKRIGILGGTFNPIHLGHLLVAQDAMEQMALDRVKFIPSATPPHKTAEVLASERDRLQMIRLAIRGNDRFQVDDIEVRRGGKSYSVDTLVELRRRDPKADFYFIIGADSLRELHLWWKAQRVVSLCTFVTVPGRASRPGPWWIDVSMRRLENGSVSTCCGDTPVTSPHGRFVRELPAGARYAILYLMRLPNISGGDGFISEGH